MTKHDLILKARTQFAELLTLKKGSEAWYLKAFDIEATLLCIRLVQFVEKQYKG